jgi:sugar (pentulose or hexulose) kinase
MLHPHLQLSPAHPGGEGRFPGILLLTGLGIGLFTDLAEAARKIAPVKRVYRPTPEDCSLYDRLADLRRNLYESLQDQFTGLAEFRKG